MTHYIIDLKKEGVKQLDRLFAEPPYSVTEREDLGSHVISIHVDDKEKDIICYDKYRIVIYYGVVETLPQEVQKDVHERLNHVDSLEKILRKNKS